jgi:hypothetical protein
LEVDETLPGRYILSKFKNYPVQMCHFHQKRIIQRYITLNPKLEASQDLKKIMTRLKYSDETRFTKALDIWYIKYKSFLNEITIHPDSGKYPFSIKSKTPKTILPVYTGSNGIAV